MCQEYMWRSQDNLEKLVQFRCIYRIVLHVCAEKGVQSPQDRVPGNVSCPVWVLGTEFRYFGRTVSSFNFICFL